MAGAPYAVVALNNSLTLHTCQSLCQVSTSLSIMLQCFTNTTGLECMPMHVWSVRNNIIGFVSGSVAFIMIFILKECHCFCV